MRKKKSIESWRGDSFFFFKKKDKMLIYKMRAYTPSPYQMKKNRVIRVTLKRSFKHELLFVEFWLLVQYLVELCEQHQQMNIQEDLVEV
jgi:hypothetical protein